ncbi:unnamed protein product [Ixodes pacificus]
MWLVPQYVLLHIFHHRLQFLHLCFLTSFMSKTRLAKYCCCSLHIYSSVSRSVSNPIRRFASKHLN